MSRGCYTCGRASLHRHRCPSQRPALAAVRTRHPLQVAGGVTGTGHSTGTAGKTGPPLHRGSRCGTAGRTVASSVEAAPRTPTASPVTAPGVTAPRRSEVPTLPAPRQVQRSRPGLYHGARGGSGAGRGAPPWALPPASLSPARPTPACDRGTGRARNPTAARKMDAAEAGAAGRAGSSADSLAEEEEDEDEAGPGSGRSGRTSSLVSGLLTELYSAAEAAAPSGSARSRALRELQQRPSQVKYLRLKGTARPACLPLPPPRRGRELPLPPRFSFVRARESCPEVPSVPARTCPCVYMCPYPGFLRGRGSQKLPTCC